MKPRFLHPDRFQVELTKRTEGFFVFRKHLFRVTASEGFALQDESGALWRPVMLGTGQTTYMSDGATIPPPLSWIGAFDPLRYQYSAMGIHDPACRTGHLQRWADITDGWQVVSVSRPQADDLLRQGIIAEGGWRVTSGAYWCGVRVGAFFGVGVRK